MKLEISEIKIMSPTFCPKCNCDIGSENTYFNFPRLYQHHVPASMRESFYCFKCLCEFMTKYINELFEFRLIDKNQ